MPIKERFRRWLGTFMDFGQDYRDLSKHIADGTLQMGAHSYGTPLILKFPGEHNRVIIGKFCSLADTARIFVGGFHHAEWVTTYAMRIRFNLPGAYEDGQPASRGDVVIGSDVWLGYGSTVLSGVHIGDGAIIGAQAMVTKDVPPYGIVAGNPARLIRKRFSEEQIEDLLKIAWWDWPLDEILAAVPLLCQPDIQAFIDYACSRQAGAALVK